MQDISRFDYLTNFFTFKNCAIEYAVNGDITTWVH